MTFAADKLKSYFTGGPPRLFVQDVCPHFGSQPQQLQLVFEDDCINFYKVVNPGNQKGELIQSFHLSQIKQFSIPNDTKWGFTARPADSSVLKDYLFDTTQGMQITRIKNEVIAKALKARQNRPVVKHAQQAAATTLGSRNQQGGGDASEVYEEMVELQDK